MPLENTITITNLTTGTLTLDNITLAQNQSAPAVFRSAQINRALALGLISVEAIDSATNQLARTNTFFRSLANGGRPAQIRD